MYNGITILRDLETSSLWHHMTGECIDGVLKGARLAGEFPIHYLSAAETATRFPQALFPVEKALSWWKRLLAEVIRRTLWIDTGKIILPVLRTLIHQPDKRLPELEMGLGIANQGMARFYPIKTLKAHSGAVIDTLADQSLAIFIDPHTNAPTAFFTDAETCHWEGKALVLDNGTKIEQGLLKSEDGNTSQMRHPHQLFSRWYGFSYTFSDCDIFTLDDA